MRSRWSITGRRRRAETVYMLVDEEDGNILAFREPLKSILNR